MKLAFLLALLLLASCAPRITGNTTEEHQRLQTTAQERMGIVGHYSDDGFDPMVFLTTWNFNSLPDEERAKVYRETSLENGSLLREYWITAMDKEIEVAPRVWFPAWT